MEGDICIKEDSDGFSVVPSRENVVEDLRACGCISSSLLESSPLVSNPGVIVSLLLASEIESCTSALRLA